VSSFAEAVIVALSVVLVLVMVTSMS
jgi:hypothetical protein